VPLRCVEAAMRRTSTRRYSATGFAGAFDFSILIFHFSFGRLAPAFCLRIKSFLQQGEMNEK
jgi:hypothetical protein